MLLRELKNTWDWNWKLFEFWKPFISKGHVLNQGWTVVCRVWVSIWTPVVQETSSEFGVWQMRSWWNPVWLIDLNPTRICSYGKLRLWYIFGHLDALLVCRRSDSYSGMATFKVCGVQFIWWSWFCIWYKEQWPWVRKFSEQKAFMLF